MIIIYSNLIRIVHEFMLRCLLLIMHTEYNYPISFTSLKYSFIEFSKGRTVCRLIHNFFLKKITIQKNVIDVGSRGKYSAYDFMDISNVGDIDFTDKFSNNEKIIYSDFETEIDIEDKKYDTAILFNVLEHVENHKNLLKEINRILKDNGKLELYVPFMHYYHEDPKDIFRPTHFYLEKMLKESGFESKIFTIGTGPFTVIADIACHYLYFSSVKLLFLFLCLGLDKCRRVFSKGASRYYLGIHASCLKK